MKEYKWCAIDAEGDVGDKGLLGVAFYSDIEGVYLTDHTDIKAALLDYASRGYTFLAHNAQYDLPVIFWQLGIDITAVYYNGRFNRGEWKYSSKYPMCQMWDTLALSGGLSLARLGQALGISKYNTPQTLRGVDPNKYEWFCEAHNAGECITCYAVRDAEIVYRFMTDLTLTLSAWGVVPHRRISGLAMQVWRTLDLPDPIHITNPRIRSLARKAFHGGRTETFKLGHITGLYTADVCSMYPSIMLEIPYPDPQYLTHMQSPHLSAVSLQYEGVAHADITVPTMYIPPLPHIYKGQLHYPTGRMVGYWTFAELRTLQQLGGTIHRIHEAAFSTRNIYPFVAFVETLWKMREVYEQQKDPRSLFAKLLMNNLYGRLGMSDDLERKDIFPAKPGVPISEQKHNEWYDENRNLYLTFEREQPSSNKWANVMWAAQTTAYARLKLHSLLMQQGTNAVYCDTDSVFSTQPIVGLGTGLGALRDEVFYPQAIIAAPKLYAVRGIDGEWQAKAKGVPRSVALKFLLEGEAEYSQPIKPTSQHIRNKHAGTWVPVTKKTQHAPARRQPVDPAALETDTGWSDTRPIWIGPKV